MWKWWAASLLWAGLFAQDIKPVEERPSSSGFNLPLTRVGGWADVMYLDNSNPNGDDYFNAPHLYLYFDTKLNRSFRTMVEFSYLNTPDRAGDGALTQLQRAYLEYRKGIPVKFRLGRFYTPAGLWKEKHGMIMVDSSHKPIIEEMGWVPTLSTGLQFLGTRVTGKWEWNYSMFGTVEEGIEEDRGSGYGADLNWTYNERFRFGLFGSDYYNNMDGADADSGQRQAVMGYAEIFLIPHKLLFRAEYLNVDRGVLESADGYYSKLKWQFHPKLFLNHRFDNADDLNALTRHRIQTLTFGYRPMPRLRTRLEFAVHNLDRQENARYNEWSAWVGFLFNFD